MTLYNDAVESNPKLKRGMVWCKSCRKSEKVDSADCLRNGWPKCCNYIMTLDHPSTWEKEQS